jgi:ankyrin repeat protein
MHGYCRVMQSGDIEAVKEVVEASPDLVNATDGRRRSSLFHAAKEGHTEVRKH